MLSTKLALVSTIAFAAATVFAVPALADTNVASTAEAPAKVQTPQIATTHIRSLDTGAVRVQSLRDAVTLNNRSAAIQRRW